MKFTFTLMFALVFTCLISCDRNDGEQPPAVTTLSPGPDVKVPGDVDIDGLISSLLDKITGSPKCNTPESNCTMEDLTFEAEQSSTASLGQRILILDQGMLGASVTRYRHRMLAHYQIDDQARLVQYEPVLTLPTVAKEVLMGLSDYPEHIPAASLQTLQAPYFEKFDFPAEAGHGDAIFAFLTESSPESQFVIGPSPLGDVWVEGIAWCDAIQGDSEQRDMALGQLEERFDMYFESLEQLVRLHQISFINASWGFERSAAQRRLQILCDGYSEETAVDQLLQIFGRFLNKFDTLTNEGQTYGIRPEVILVQAGVKSENILVENDVNYPSDCDSSLKHRLRVGAYLDYSANIAPEGSNSTDHLSPVELNALACTDVYITLGQGTAHFSIRDKREKALGDSPLGLGWGPLTWPPALSFAAPVSLSSLLSFEQNLGMTLSAEQLLSAYTRDGEALIQDPIQHDLFQFSELGY